MSLDITSSPRRSATAHEYVREELRRAIMDGTLPGGTRLRQSELANQLGVSTTPVREALRDLTAEQLVVMHPHHGAMVRSLELAEVREIYELRIALEPILARRVVGQLDDETLEQAAALQQSMHDERDPGRFSRLNRDFHSLLGSPEDHSRLGIILAGLRDSAAPYVGMSLFSKPELIEQSNREHALFIELFRKKDVEGVVNLTIRHLQATLQAVEDSHHSKE